MGRICKIEKNDPKWVPTESDYILCFLEVDGMWRECSNNIPKYFNMTFADYLNEVEIYNIPEHTQFLRIWDYDRNMGFEYHADGGRIVVNVYPMFNN